MATNRVTVAKVGAGTAAVTYDVAGNMIGHPQLSGGLQYDVEGRQTAANGASYVYDGEGRRVKTSYASADTYFVYGGDGSMVAEYGAGDGSAGLRYRTVDVLGSTRLVTDGARVVVGRSDYWPFGEEVIGSASYNGRDLVSGYGGGGARQKFTGKERDQETGLDYFGARYLSGGMGRWTSPDSINVRDERVLNPANTLNKYIYGGNNPLKYTDPDGRDITVFYTGTGNAGHFWMAAYNEGNGQSAIMDFGPANGASQARMIGGRDVPGNTNYASHMTSANEIRRDYASLTIETNPEETQKAITAINSTNASQPAYNLLGANCTTVCRDVLQKILDLKTNSIRPTALWSNIYLRWSKEAQQPRKATSRGSSAPQVKSTHGVDFGNPRYGINTFDFVWNLVEQQGQQRQDTKVTSKTCFEDANGKQVCQ